MKMSDVPSDVLEKYDALKEYIRGLGTLAVGFSGGVDSTFLLAVAHDVLGDKAVAVTTEDAAFPQRELSEAKDFCSARGIRHITCVVDPMTEDAFRFNKADRCYYCKRLVFSEIGRVASENGIEFTAEGSNMDDLGDYRPGLAAAEELGVKCPLREAKLYKEEIRQLSRAMDLPTWSKPAYACLATRFACGEELTVERLQMVEKAEQVLIDLGFPEERVRVHGDIARIEVPPCDIDRLASEEIRTVVYDKLLDLGFSFVSLDLGGYRMGNMNPVA